MIVDAPAPEAEPPRPGAASSPTAVAVARGRLVSGGCGLLLLVALVAFAWYGVDEAPGRISGAERIATTTGWDALTATRWLVVLTAAIALAAALAGFVNRRERHAAQVAAALTILGTVTAAALTYRVLIDLPSAASIVDQKLGAWVGMLSAYGIALGSYHSLRAARAHARTAPEADTPAAVQSPNGSTPVANATPAASATDAAAPGSAEARTGASR